MHSHERLQSKLRFAVGEKILKALNDPNVIEVMLNEDGRVWIDTFEGMKCYSQMAEKDADSMIRTIASISETVINREHPDISVEIHIQLSKDENQKLFRFQGLIPPIVPSPIFAIRKPASRIFTLKDYADQEILTLDQKAYLEKAIYARKNILVVGGTGSGKTTLCNALLDEVAKTFSQDRIVIIEDTIELQCNVENKVQLRTSENRDMNDLVKYCMRLRPDRIVVGEVRGKEAHSLIKAWNTGHPGGISTVHANDAMRGLVRIEQLVQEANVKPVPAAIAEAINVVVFVIRAAGTKGGRLVKEILEINGYDKVTEQYRIKVIPSMFVETSASIIESQIAKNTLIPQTCE